MTNPKYQLKTVLVTGATGLVGSHVVANLLGKGIKVIATARSERKAQVLRNCWPDSGDQLCFFYITDLTAPGAFDDAVQGVDAVIHVASPLSYTVTDKEKELIIPAIEGVKSILNASLKSDTVKRVVITSSFGSVLDMSHSEEAPYTYSARDWNPITYAEGANASATPQDAYRASKTLAEQEAWNFMKEKSPAFDLVTLCPSMVFGPVATPISSASDLNESNAVLWSVATGGPTAPLPPARFNFWIDVRDLAEVHVAAAFNPQAGGKRYIPVSPEKFTYEMASDIIRREFPEWGEKEARRGSQRIKDHLSVDLSDVQRDFPELAFTSFQNTVIDLIKQVGTAEGRVHSKSDY